MKVAELTPAERLILSNQYRILATIDKEDSKDYGNKAQIVENGYSGLYYKLFEHISEEVDAKVTEQTSDILAMFRIINWSIDSLSKEEKTQLDKSNLVFEGFDGNHDAHYSQAIFMIENLNVFQESDLNSHSQFTLPRYLKQLKVYNELYDAGKPLKLEALQEIAKVKHY